jgi:hypothetical protein
MDNNVLWEQNGLYTENILQEQKKKKMTESGILNYIVDTNISRTVMFSVSGQVLAA